MNMKQRALLKTCMDTLPNFQIRAEHIMRKPSRQGQRHDVLQSIAQH